MNQENGMGEPACTPEQGARFTKGPWRVDRTVALGAYGVWTDYGDHPGHDNELYPSQICSVFAYNKSHFPQAERDANAQLIAAAPDLLEACKVALGAIKDAHNECCTEAARTLIIAAISKALDAAEVGP